MLFKKHIIKIQKIKHTRAHSCLMLSWYFVQKDVHFWLRGFTLQYSGQPIKEWSKLKIVFKNFGTRQGIEAIEKSLKIQSKLEVKEVILEVSKTMAVIALNCAIIRLYSKFGYKYIY